MVSCALLVVGDMLAWSGIATAQQESSAVELNKDALEVKKLSLEIEKLTNDLSLRDLERKKADFEAEKARLEVTKLNELRTLETQKAQLEVEKLHKEANAFPAWLAYALTLLVSGVGIVVTYWVARRVTFGALDQSVHDKRLELYPELVKATAPFALHFPPQVSLKPIHCRAVGLSLRTWYFQGGGILLSVKARNAYFTLARELTRASLVNDLAVPVFSTDAQHVNAKQVKKYVKILELNKQNGMENEWIFGPCTPSGASTTEEQRLAYQFRDFVFLQHLSSTLRTKLSEDLRSRLRPAAPESRWNKVVIIVQQKLSLIQRCWASTWDKIRHFV